MVNIQEYKKRTINHLNNALKSVWLTNENLDEENKEYESKIQNENDSLENIEKIRFQVTKNIIGTINAISESPESDKVKYEFMKENFEEGVEFIFDVVGDYEVFSKNLKKSFEWYKEIIEKELKDKEWNLENSNEPLIKEVLELLSEKTSSALVIRNTGEATSTSEPTLSDWEKFREAKWNLVKKVCSELTKAALSPFTEKENIENVLERKNHDYEQKINSVADSEEIKEIFRSILEDGILLQRVRAVAILMAEELLKKGTPEEQKMYNERLEPMVEGYKEEVKKMSNITDIITLTNERTNSFSVELIKLMMLHKKTKNAYLKYLKMEDLGTNSDNVFFHETWLKICYRDTNSDRLINYSLWEEHFQNHVGSFVESGFTTFKLIEMLRWVDENKDEILERAKKMVINEVKEKELTIDNLEEKLERMTVIEQVENFKKWEIDGGEKELSLSPQTREDGGKKQTVDLQELQRKIDAYKEKLEKIWGNDKEYKEFEAQIEIPPKK